MSSETQIGTKHAFMIYIYIFTVCNCTVIMPFPPHAKHSLSTNVITIGRLAPPCSSQHLEYIIQNVHVLFWDGDAMIQVFSGIVSVQREREKK